jgi:cytochrome c556
MKTKTILGAVAVAVLMTGLAATVAPNDPKLTTREVMRAKLDSSQKVLEGIATENFVTIAVNGQKLVALSQAAGWEARQTPEYKQHTIEFRRHAEALQKAARDQNVDAASLAWFQLTISCVNCHRHIRGVRTVSAEPMGLAELVAAR